MKLKCIVSALIFSCAGSIAASESNGKVIDYWIHNNHDSFAFSIENQTGRPPCATFGSPSGRYVVDTRTERGKIVVSAIMAAKVSGSNVRAAGSNLCNYYGDSEDLVWVHVK